MEWGCVCMGLEGGGGNERIYSVYDVHDGIFISVSLSVMLPSHY